jgi:hypothetical protein
MKSSFKVLPSSEIKPKTSGEQTEFGVNDSFREGLRSISSEITNKHPLESHLEKVFPD